MESVQSPHFLWGYRAKSMMEPNKVHQSSDRAKTTTHARLMKQRRDQLEVDSRTDHSLLERKKKTSPNHKKEKKNLICSRIVALLTHIRVHPNMNG